MTRTNGGLCILTCLSLMLALHVFAQSTQQTLENTMVFIGNTLNSRGPVSWNTTFHERELSGAEFKTTNSLAQIKADSSTCSIAWTSIETAVDDKTVETHSVHLQTVSSVDVQPYSRSMSSQTRQGVEYSPETYFVEIKTTKAIAGHRQSFKKNKLKSKGSSSNNHEAKIQFSNEETASRVADAIRHAVSLCGVKQSHH